MTRLIFVLLWCTATPVLVAESKETRSPASLAAEAKEILRRHCIECHGDSRASAGLHVLNRADLIDARRVIVPGKPEESELVARISAKDDSVMPEPPRAALSGEEIDLLRRWIAAGAPEFPADAPLPEDQNKELSRKGLVGADYVLNRILADVRRLNREDRRYVRYFSMNHVLTAGATSEAMKLHRDALAKAINHLSWERDLVRPRSIDAPTDTVFAVDLRRLGWHRKPYEVWDLGKRVRQSELNVFDLVLLEYPYGVVHEGSETFDLLAGEFLEPAGCVRPIPYVRSDWFVSTATQPPLYEDILGLPFALKELEERLGVDSQENLRDRLVKRAGMTVSGVSRNNRVVERHPSQHTGYYWASIDYRSSKGQENMFRDPIHLEGAGGEFIFQLPNRMQGYFVASAAGERIEAAPTDIVTDKFASDRTVRNGLACIRCHENGMQQFVDTVRPALLSLPGSPGFDRSAALALYPERSEMDALLESDGRSFRSAVEDLFGHPQLREPLIPVTRAFLDDPIHLRMAAGELGLADASGLESVFRTPQFAALGLMPLASGGVVRRDAWEDYFAAAVKGMGLGKPIHPVDGVTHRDRNPAEGSSAIQLRTNKKSNVFEPGDELVIFVTNRSQSRMHFELIGTGARGEKVLLTPSVESLAPGATYRYPPQGTAPIIVRARKGKEQLTLFAASEPFESGELLRGRSVTDRVVHRDESTLRQRRPTATEPSALSKTTIDLETK